VSQQSYPVFRFEEQKDRIPYTVFCQRNRGNRMGLGPPTFIFVGT